MARRQDGTVINKIRVAVRIDDTSVNRVTVRIDATTSNKVTVSVTVRTNVTIRTSSRFPFQVPGTILS